MKTEFDVGQTVWSSKEYYKWVTLARIIIDADGITYEDLNGNHHSPESLSTEEPSITHEQFLNAVNATPLESQARKNLVDVWEIVQECFKEVHKCTTTED